MSSKSGFLALPVRNRPDSPGCSAAIPASPWVGRRSRRRGPHRDLSLRVINRHTGRRSVNSNGGGPTIHLARARRGGRRRPGGDKTTRQNGSTAAPKTPEGKSGSPVTGSGAARSRVFALRGDDGDLPVEYNHSMTMGVIAKRSWRHERISPRSARHARRARTRM